MRLARSILIPASSQKVQEGNASRGTKRRLYRDTNTQVVTRSIIASMLSHSKVETLLKDPKLSYVGTRMANETLDRIGGHVGPAMILEACDSGGIPADAYAQIYKKLKSGVRAAGRGIQIGCLPTPNVVSMLRSELNSKLHDFVGEYYHIDDNITFPASSKSKKSKEPKNLNLNEMNNIFVDVEAVQRTMVCMYEITTAGN
jgi:hypothetical protein